MTATNENFYGMLSSYHHYEYRVDCDIAANLPYPPPLVDIEKIRESIDNTYVSNKFKLLCAKVNGIPANTIVGEIYGHILTNKLNDAIELEFHSKYPGEFNFSDPKPDHFNYFTHLIEGKLHETLKINYY